MAASTSRNVVLALVLAAVIGGASWLVDRGVDFTGKQKRAGELAETIRSRQSEMAELYDRRSSMISTWLDEQAARKPISDARSEAQDAAAQAEAHAAGAEPPVPAADPTRIQEELNAVRAALEESRGLTLRNQQQFDRFDRLQNQIGNYVTQQLLEQLRAEASQGKGPVTLDQIREFEQLEMEIANTRRDYHAAAFERNRLLDDIGALPFGLSRPAPPVPVFPAERLLHEQQAGR